MSRITKASFAAVILDLKRHWVRASIAAIVFAVLIWQTIMFLFLLQDVRAQTTEGKLAYNDAVQRGADLLIQQSEIWAQAAILMLSVLGAFWVAKADQPRLALKLRLWPELVMWGSGALMLLLSLLCYNLYLSGVANAFRHGTFPPIESERRTANLIHVPNIFDEPYTSVRDEQFLLLVVGGSVAALAVFIIRFVSRGSST